MKNLKRIKSKEELILYLSQLDIKFLDIEFRHVQPKHRQPSYDRYMIVDISCIETASNITFNVHCSIPIFKNNNKRRIKKDIYRDISNQIQSNIDDYAESYMMSAIIFIIISDDLKMLSKEIDEVIDLALDKIKISNILA